jgi:hypothetical protein
VLEDKHLKPTGNLLVCKPEAINLQKLIFQLVFYLATGQISLVINLKNFSDFFKAKANFLSPLDEC